MAFFGPRQVRNELELNGHRVVGNRGSIGGEAPGLEKKESGLEARHKLEAYSAEYKEVESYFLERLNPSERNRCRIETIEKLNVPDIADQCAALSHSRLEHHHRSCALYTILVVVRMDGLLRGRDTWP